MSLLFFLARLFIGTIFLCLFLSQIVNEEAKSCLGIIGGCISGIVAVFLYFPWIWI